MKAKKQATWGKKKAFMFLRADIRPRRQGISAQFSCWLVKWAAAATAGQLQTRKAARQTVETVSVLRSSSTAFVAC